ncbi:hypothetical protein NP493_203g01005 [Ridgeia piscesae]|uniref:Nucleoprotein TPR/MLP1-2 domain-containing protein n=1 Tax=Ridgeia piscesae TaxID=27915 RepID=A0AAD9P1D9_RIDPI|nr:hypothetical protein NP493_203g01005 [Ridgeia piscesae]
MEEQTTEREQLQERVELLEKENQQLLDDNYSVTEQSHAKNAELQTRLLTLQPELEESIKRREAAIANEQAARRDSEEQARLAREVQEKYERELMSHAEAVDTLTKTKQELEGFNIRLTEANESARIAKKTLEDARLAWEIQEQNLKEENGKLRASVQELQRQNQILHEEMEQLSSRMVQLQEVQASHEKESAQLAETVAANPTDQSSENLLEVIR